jgi:hypothetical protein
MRETRLQNFPRRWRTACRAAIQEVVEYGGTELISVMLGQFASKSETVRRSKWFFTVPTPANSPRIFWMEGTEQDEVEIDGVADSLLLWAFGLWRY